MLAVALMSFFLLRSSHPGPPKAAIIDQLSLTAPNPDFAREAKQLLMAAGYRVDYFPGEQVNVELFRTLPKHGYDIVLVRAHAGRRIEASGELKDDAAVFTSEPYSSSRYAEEQQQGLLAAVTFSSTDSTAWFGIPPPFVAHEMQGDLHGAMVILMGCDVLRGQALAEAFRSRGAKAVVGWNGSVSASHTDAATLSLLRHYLGDHGSVQQAAAAAMDEVGPDPGYGSMFVADPARS